jgi:hypothetical protein
MVAGITWNIRKSFMTKAIVQLEEKFKVKNEIIVYLIRI